jgi:glycopeptide antibiotics resistance protein
MQSGTTGLHLSYEDTVTDLLLSSSGGLVGSLVMVRLFPKSV